MPTYQEEQFKLFEGLEKQFRQNKSNVSTIKPIKNHAKDKRKSLTSVVFLPRKLQNLLVNKIIKPLKKAGKGIYFYPAESLHATIKNIRIINYPPTFDGNDIKKVKKVFNKVIPKRKSFEFELKGLFETPNSLSVRAYSSEALKLLVKELSKKLVKCDLPDDKKYASNEIFFGNITVCRYYIKPKPGFFKIINKLKNIYIGKFSVKKIILITTDSVCHPSKTKKLGYYNLKS
jgi:2'-5' RNA ligase